MNLNCKSVKELFHAFPLWYLHPLEQGCLHKLKPLMRILRRDKEVEIGQITLCNSMILSETPCKTMSKLPVVIELLSDLEKLSPFSPFDSNTSEVTLTVKGKSLGMIGLRAFSARAPMNTHRRKHEQTHIHTHSKIVVGDKWLQIEDIIYFYTHHVQALSCLYLPSFQSHWLHMEGTEIKHSVD